VHEYDPASNTVVLDATDDTLRAMPLSLRSDRGRFHAALTSAVDTSRVPEGQVRRKIGRIFLGDADRIRDGWISGWCANEPSDFGLDFEEVDMSVDGSSPRPAWLASAANDTGVWAIHIHGRTAARQETIRSMQAFVASGVSSAAISYRAEADARTSNRDRVSTLGVQESDDVLLAMNWLAHNRGAKGFILVGWSLGAVIAAEALRRSVGSRRIVGLVSVSGVVDLQATLESQATTATGSSGVAKLAMSLMSGGLHRLSGLNAAVDATKLGLAKLNNDELTATLLLHSTDDHYVPIAPARKIAIDNPDLVQLVEFTGGGHVKEWNSNPKLWAEAIEEWLALRLRELK